VIAILWTYDVKPEARERFEEVYGPSGQWAELFGRAEGYLGTEPFRGPEGAYLTIDRWRAEADFAAFMGAHRANYEALDRTTEGWTLAQRKIGVWEAVE
jgi:heme-degrading monooxygenase HmoA